MKYIMVETKDGQKLPIVFPDSLTHAHVAGAMQLVLQASMPGYDLRDRQLMGTLEDGPGKVASAGFVSIGQDILVYGMSESLGGVESRPSDAARIIAGGALQYLPDSMAEATLRLLKGRD